MMVTWRNWKVWYLMGNILNKSEIVPYFCTLTKKKCLWNIEIALDKKTLF